ncbi:hypothetical protein QQS21_000160 [Conoideocrella luteorostrata]|uniref:Xylanolytic transcriptional activator regulatory domain-containing protein n=1 Tax=Conoideocrella luteorostrata TaxID=1105319 RepID=A0AAJ0CZ65_9HYPO|nr:hypothetical protein QQS21_000160 [Conoideocrella luteorostrata]
MQEYFGPPLAANNPFELSQDVRANENDVFGRNSAEELCTWTWCNPEEHLFSSIGLNYLFFESVGPGSSGRTSEPIHYTPDLELKPKIREIGEGLRARLSTGTSIETISSSIELIFADSNVYQLVTAYFDNWHCHNPMLHRPSFKPSSTFAPLLSAVMLVGAIYSTDEHARAARNCFDAAEEYVFTHESFRELYDPHSGSGVQPLQAAYIICILRQWDSHRGSRRRVRLQLYPSIVSAARSLGLTKLRHMASKKSDHAPSYDDWKEFIKTEEKIRLMAWIFLVDTSHAIFYGTPPRLTVSEMTGCLPCDDQLFMAHGPESFHDLSTLATSSKLCSVSRGVSLFFAQEWTRGSIAEFGQLNYLDFFLLVHALHQIIFSNKATYSLRFTKSAIECALERWEDLWNTLITDKVEMDSYKVGFFKYANDYWWLAKLLVRTESPHFEPKKMGEDFDHDSTAEVNSLLKRFASIALS